MSLIDDLRRIHMEIYERYKQCEDETVKDMLLTVYLHINAAIVALSKVED